MEGVMVRLLVGIVFALTWLIAAPAFAQNSAQFKQCPASATDEFADCTFAQHCTWNTDGTLNCPDCKIRRDLASVVSATAECVHAGNHQIQSRFPGTGLKYVQLCGPKYQPQYQKKWASCLDVMCKDTGGTTATCACGQPADGVPYVAARETNSYDPKLCTAPDAAISSATQAAANAIQQFLHLPLSTIVNPPGAQ
jgi:hypothetical protein